jgi:hypothetical protein
VKCVSETVQRGDDPLPSEPTTRIPLSNRAISHKERSKFDYKKRPLWDSNALSIDLTRRSIRTSVELLEEEI